MLVKKFNETSELLSTVDFLSNRHADVQQYWHRCSFHFKWKATQCHASSQKIENPSHSWKHRDLQFEETVRNFEITALTKDISALLDKTSSLVDVVW